MERQEQWKAFHHREQFSALVVVNKFLINFLVEKNALYHCDVAHLENLSDHGENNIKAKELLRILVVRKQGLRVLGKALCEDGQREAWDFLQTKCLIEGCDSSRNITKTSADADENKFVYLNPWLPWQDFPPSERYWKGPLGQCFGYPEISRPVLIGGGFSSKPQRAKFKVPDSKAWYFYDEESQIGDNNTPQVFSGFWGEDEQQKVAVEFVDKKKCSTLSEELELAKKIFRERNNQTNHIVPVIDWSETETSFFIVWELTETDLLKAIDEQLLEGMETKIKILKNSVQGLQWLHNQQDTIHRNIRPENIFLFQYGTKVVAKLGNFGHILWIAPTWPIITEPDSFKWMAPDVFIVTDRRSGRIVASSCSKYTKSIDIFSLGMVFYFCLSDGQHPFLIGVDFESSRKNKSIEPFPLQKFSPEFRYFSAKNLVKWMLQKYPEDRPNIDQVRNHPFFWNEEKNLEYLENVSRALNRKDKGHPLQQTRKKLDDFYRLQYNSNYDKHFNWLAEVSASLLQRDDSSRVKKYDSNSVVDLIELIRDKAEHYQDLTSEAKTALFQNEKPSRTMYATYFLQRFPDIVITTFMWFKEEVDSQVWLETLKNHYFKLYCEDEFFDCE